MLAIACQSPSRSCGGCTLFGMKPIMLSHCGRAFCISQPLKIAAPTIQMISVLVVDDLSRLRVRLQAVGVAAGAGFE